MRVNKIYFFFRRDYLNGVFSPAIKDTLKAVTARFQASELITNRSAVRTQIEGLLGERLNPFGMKVIAVSITNFEFSPSFSQAIEAKVTAVQRALEAENKLRQIQIEAQQVEAAAVGQANARIAEATGQKAAAIASSEGEAQAIFNVANAQAEANTKIAKSLTPELIQYNISEHLAQDLKTIILPPGANFIFGPEVLGVK